MLYVQVFLFISVDVSLSVYWHALEGMCFVWWTLITLGHES